MTHEELYDALKYLVQSGQLVISRVRVNDCGTTVEYASLSACPVEYREGYRRALEICKDVYIRDVAYLPVFNTKSNAKSIATLE